MSSALRMAAAVALRDRAAPAAMGTGDLRDWLAVRFPEAGASALAACVRDLCDSGLLRRVTRNVVLNTLRTPAAPAQSAACLIRRGAVVSLQTVLGEAGFLNNPAVETTAVVPASFSQRVGLEESSGGFRFRFRALPDHMFPDEGDASCFDPRKKWPCFRPEKALVDWLRLSSPKSRSDMAPPPVDSDESALDADRLESLAERFGVAAELADWRERVALLDGGEEMGRVRRLGM